MCHTSVAMSNQYTGGWIMSLSDDKEMIMIMSLSDYYISSDANKYLVKNERHEWVDGLRMKIDEDHMHHIL